MEGWVYWIGNGKVHGYKECRYLRQKMYVPNYVMSRDEMVDCKECRRRMEKEKDGMDRPGRGER